MAPAPWKLTVSGECRTACDLSPVEGVLARSWVGWRQAEAGTAGQQGHRGGSRGEDTGHTTGHAVLKPRAARELSSAARRRPGPSRILRHLDLRGGMRNHGRPGAGVWERRGCGQDNEGILTVTQMVAMQGWLSGETRRGERDTGEVLWGSGRGP